jgi:pimeloyl-ACP methyl ester carboxylesterase
MSRVRVHTGSTRRRRRRSALAVAVGGAVVRVSTPAARAAPPGSADEVLALPPQAPRIVDDCGIRDVGAADASVHEPVRSPVPALLLTGTFDAVTPPGWAREAAEGLSRAHLLEFPGLGHSVVLASGWAAGVVAGFLDRPEGGYDTACLEQVTVPEFSTGP